MNNLFIVGSQVATAEYIQEYIKKNNFIPIEIAEFKTITKIEDARSINKALGYRVKTKKLTIFTGEITAEAQNSLLKNIEEANENIHFIFASENEDSLLPTVKSRCLLVRINSERKGNPEVLSYLKEICRSHGNWEHVDDLSTYMENADLSDIVPALRTLLLENIENDNCVFYYEYCKKILTTLPFVTHNNMNRRIAVESVFI